MCSKQYNPSKCPLSTRTKICNSSGSTCDFHTTPSCRPYHSVIPALSRNPETSLNRNVANPRLPGFPRSRERQVRARILPSTLNSYQDLTPTHSNLTLRGAQRRGNLVAVATAVRRRGFNLIEIANPRIEYGVAMTSGNNRKPLRAGRHSWQVLIASHTLSPVQDELGPSFAHHNLARRREIICVNGVCPQADPVVGRAANSFPTSHLLNQALGMIRP